METNIYLGIGWLVYGVIHSVLASESIKNKISTQYYRLIYNALAIILMIPLFYWLTTKPSASMMPSSLISQLLSGLMILSGIYIIYLSFKNYDVKEFLGLNFKDNQEKQVLQTEGLSSLIRHPLYTGTLLFVWGLFGYFTTEAYFITAVCLTLYIRIGIYFEEKKLLKTFGKSYEKYQKEVPMLIPKI